MHNELEKLAFDLGETDFDIMLVGDGAGSLVDTSCGWYVTLYERASKKVTQHYGGTNGGTNMFAELEPFIHAINSYRHTLYSYHTQRYGQDSTKPVINPPKVFIVSDSKVTVECGNRNFTRKANAPLWASIEWLEKKGYKFKWVHVPRNSNFFNKTADEGAKKVRKSLSQIGELNG